MIATCLAMTGNLHDTISSRLCLSHAKTCYISHAHFMHQRLLWDIPEIFGAKDDEAANFKKIIRV